MNLVDATARHCHGYDLPLNLVLAIGKVESALDPYAIRFEPRYRWMWDSRRNRAFRRLGSAEVAGNEAPNDFKVLDPTLSGFFSSADTEWTGQKMSWGPFQMMGALMRECGYRGPFPKLCDDHDLSARFACLHIAKLKVRYHRRHGWSGVVAAYNAGRPRRDSNGYYLNQSYVNKVAEAGVSNLVTVRT